MVTPLVGPVPVTFRVSSKSNLSAALLLRLLLSKPPLSPAWTRPRPHVAPGGLHFAPLFQSALWSRTASQIVSLIMWLFAQTSQRLRHLRSLPASSRCSPSARYLTMLSLCVLDLCFCCGLCWQGLSCLYAAHFFSSLKPLPGVVSLERCSISNLCSSLNLRFYFIST